MMQQSKKLILSLFAVLSVLLITRVITLAPGLIDASAAACSYPLLVIQDTVCKPVGLWRERKRTLQELTQEVVAYKQQLSSLLSENIVLKATLLHLGQIDEVLRFSGRYKTNRLLVGQVILKQYDDSAHFFLLDIGQRRGVCKDMIAVFNNFLVGRVCEVNPYFCKVMLITDKTSKVPVICLGTKTQGIFEGMGSQHEGKMNFVSHLQSLTSDDCVVSSGDGLIYPKGFIVGRVKDFSLNALGLTYQVTVELLSHLDEMTYCCLIQKGAEYDSTSDVAPQEIQKV